MRHLSILLVASVLLGGCATQKYLEATGGSRSDGVVELSYEYGFLERPEIHWDEALVIARQRCAAWGYSNAERFGGQKSECRGHDGYGNCLKFFVTVSYQCTGTPHG